MKIIGLALVILLSGCASITGSKMQPISIQTTEGSAIVSGASCVLTNDAGKWFLQTPGSVTVQKSTGDLTVECARKEVSGHETVVSKANTNVWGNILIGGVIGYAIDRTSGAGFDYPPSVTVALFKGGVGNAAVAMNGAAVPLTDGPWKALMSCDANKVNPARGPYQARFLVEVNGNMVTLHRQNKVAVEALSGAIDGNMLVLTGMGSRIDNPNNVWQYKFSGPFAGNSSVYSANGDMLSRNKSVRSCTLMLIRTDIAPIDAGADEATDKAQ